jgi:NAD(P)-dependent dehydrogenase (short-subunit alcohol dehydrogenase family)
VLVTGGASGIGAALVDSFAAQGASVTFLDVADDDATKVVRRNATATTPPRYLHCDVTDVSALQSIIEAAVAQHGPVRVLVNNAANDDRHDWKSVTSEQWDARMAVNLKHHFFAIQAVAEEMANAGGGSIINFSSIAWMLGLGGMPAYVSAKAAVIGLTRSFARDLGERDIRVNCVLPGWVMTDRQRDLYMTPQAEEALLRDQCIPRLILPEEVAALVLFLAADESAACTAQSFVIDRGWT